VGQTNGWEYLTSLKRKFPQAVVKHLALSSNGETTHFFRHHPLIDEFETGMWADPRKPGYKAFKYCGNYRLLMADTNYEDPIISKLDIIPQRTFYLSNQDKEMVAEIAGGGPYVVLHPFAGGTTRMVMPIEQYFPLIPALRDLGIRVVVVGANWQKDGGVAEQGFAVGKPKLMRELFQYRGEGLVNLIDKVNAMVVVGLLLRAVCLVSVRSFCFSATRSGLVNSVLLVSDPSHVRYMTPRQTYNNLLDFGWRESILDRKIKIIGMNNFSDTRDKIIESVKRFAGERHEVQRMQI
jgi:hypothetical protein